MATENEMQERVDTFPKLCRRAGLKVTPQRIAVFQMLANTKSHPSPEEVYNVIRKTSPSISLATVYKILDLFQGQGFIRRVATQNQVTRYDADISPHYHLVCIQCGTILDFFPNGAPIQPVKLPDTMDFSVTECEVQFHGLCAKCRN